MAEREYRITEVKYINRSEFIPERLQNTDHLCTNPLWKRIENRYFKTYPEALDYIILYDKAIEESIVLETLVHNVDLSKEESPLVDDEYLANLKELSKEELVDYIYSIWLRLNGEVDAHKDFKGNDFVPDIRYQELSYNIKFSKLNQIRVILSCKLAEKKRIADEENLKFREGMRKFTAPNYKETEVNKFQEITRRTNTILGTCYVDVRISQIIEALNKKQGTLDPKYWFNEEKGCIYCGQFKNEADVYICVFDTDKYLYGQTPKTLDVLYERLNCRNYV